MATIGDFLDSLLGEGNDFASEELNDLIDKAKRDSQIFIRHMGELAEEFIKLRALNKINNDEFKELMLDIVDMEKMQVRLLSVQAKARAQDIVRGFKELIIDKLMTFLEEKIGIG